MSVVLGIESSCDETGIALVSDGCRVLVNDISSQIKDHAVFGGVVPEIASRKHTERITELVENVMSKSPEPIEAVAVTRGPGLMGSLLVGLSFAKAYACSKNLPCIPVHHIEGHLYSAFLEGEPPSFPFLALVVSGGHTQLIFAADHHQYELLATTRDDAVGESFDKVARLLGLPYPGGPSIQKAAETGNESAFTFPRAFADSQELAFSYSGLKTAVLYARRDNPEASISDIAASFQHAAVDALVKKTLHALRATGAPRLAVVGGVAANRLLRERLLAEASVPVHIPAFEFCTDNGAMIASAGYWRWRNGFGGELTTTARPSWKLCEQV